MAAPPHSALTQGRPSPSARQPTPSSSSSFGPQAERSPLTVLLSAPWLTPYYIHLPWNYIHLPWSAPPMRRTRINPPSPPFDRIAATCAALVIVGLAVFLLIRNQPIADPRLFLVLRVVVSFSAATLGA